MNISRKSWHYKLHRFYMDLDYRDHMTLCYYFWTVVCGVLKALIVLSILLAFVSLLVCVGYRLIVAIPLRYFVGLPIAAGVVFAVSLLRKFFRNKRAPTAIKSNSIILSYIAARKKKFCPFIEFED